MPVDRQGAIDASIGRVQHPPRWRYGKRNHPAAADAGRAGVAFGAANEIALKPSKRWSFGTWRRKGEEVGEALQIVHLLSDILMSPRDNRPTRGGRGAGVGAGALRPGSGNAAIDDTAMGLFSAPALAVDTAPEATAALRRRR